MAKKSTSKTPSAPAVDRAAPCSSPLTVDRRHLIAWNDGILLHFENGAGIAVNELECIAAEKALERGEIVLLRDGARLTGNHVVLIGGCIHERLGMQTNVQAHTRAGAETVAETTDPQTKNEL